MDIVKDLMEKYISYHVGVLEIMEILKLKFDLFSILNLCGFTTK